MLNKAMPEKTVRMHSSDKPWMTTQIKTQIEARQRAFSLGDKSTYKNLCEHVSNLITKAKLNYNRNEAKDFRISNPRKCYVYLCPSGSPRRYNKFHIIYASDDDLLAAEQLQGAFTKSWKDLTVDICALMKLNIFLKIMHHLCPR